LVLGSMQVEIRVEVRRCDLSGEAREQGAVPGEPASMENRILRAKLPTKLR
jgi:hypothetical protein